MKCFCLSLLALCSLRAVAQHELRSAQIDAQVRAVMTSTGSKGLAIAVIDSGRVRSVRTYGLRNDKGDTGTVHPYDQRSEVRTAGSMDTTIADFAKFAAALVHGSGLSPTSRAEMVRP